MLVEDIILNVIGDVNGFIWHVSSVQLYNSNYDLIAREQVTDATVEFNNIKLEFMGEQIVYVTIQAKWLWYNQSGDGYGTDDFQFNIEVTDAICIDSGVEMVAGPTDDSSLVAVKPVLLNDVSLTDYDNAELTSVFQTIGNFTITADTRDNNKETNSSDAELELLSATLTCSAVHADALELTPVGGNSSVTSLCAGGVVRFDLTGLDKADRVLDAGEYAQFHISLDGSYTPVDGDSISLKFDTNNGSSLIYAEADDTTCVAGSCVTELRLGDTYFWSAEASN